MKKKFFFAFFAILACFTLFACRKENPTVDIKLESTVNSISYDLTFDDIKNNNDRKYKIVLSNESTVIVEDVNLLTEVQGEFKNLQYDTVYTLTVYVGKKAKSTEYDVEIGKESISTKLNEFKNITFEGLNTTYDGKEKSIYVSGAPEGTNIEYTNNGVKDAGTYEVTAKLTKAGYKELVLKANIVISKNKHSFTFNNFSKEYDGTPIDVAINTDLDITYEYYSGTTKLESAPVNVGEYTVKAKYAGDKNNEAFELSAKYTILEADINLELSNKTVVYTGLPQTLEANTDLEVTYEYYLGNNKLTEAPVNVGKYIVKAIYAGDSNHEAKTVEAILTIVKASTTISVPNKEIVVDYGKTYSLNASVSNGATPTITYNTTDGKAPVNVGKYTATISYAGDDNHEASENVVVNITIIQAEVELELNGKTVTYNGEAHTLEVETTLDIVYEYYLGETKLSSAPVNAGVYTVKAIFAGDANHEAKTVEATLTIKKVIPTLSVEDIEVTYNGEAQTVVATLSNGATPTIIYNTTDGNAPVDAGDYTAVVSYVGDENNEGITDKTVNIIIKKVQVTLITSTDIEVTYDGKSHAVSATLSNDAEPTIVYDTEDGKAPVNAGEYVATISYAGDKNHEAVSTVKVDIIINKATYDMSDITFEDLTVTYDGQVHEIIINGTLPTGVEVEYINNSGVEVGSYKAVAEFIYDVDNYNYIPNMEAYLTINKAQFDLSGISFEDMTVEYDGETHEIVITGTLPIGIEVSYINNKGTSAGYYSATAKFTSDDPNFESIPSMTAKLTITKANVVITAEDLTVTYDGNRHTVPATISHGVEISHVTLKHLETGSYKEWENGTAGTYQVEFQYDGDDNHNKAKKVVTMTIEKATPVITIANKNIVVDLYEEYDIEYSISNDLTAVLTYNTENEEKPVDAGTYTATISFAGNTNYNAVSEIINITIINPAYKNITVEVEDVEVSYGQSYKVNYKVTDSDGNVVDDYTEDQVRISVFNSTTLPINAGEYEVLVEVSARHDIFLNAGSGKGSIVINKIDIDISGVVFEDKTVTYTGEEIRMEATNLPEGISYGCRYLINDQIAPNIVDAGIYKVELVLYNDREDSQNYNPIPIKVAYLTILKADTELFIPFDNYEIEYGTAILPLASVENGDTDNLEIKYYNSNDEEVELPSAVGEYYAVIKYLGNKNYNAIEAQTVTLVIKALNYDFGFVGPFRKTYDGTPLTVKINQELDVEYKYYKINDWNEEVLITGYPTNAGNYIVRVTVPAGNGYADYTVQQTLIIDYAETVLTVKFNGEVITEGQNVQVNYREDYDVTATVAHGDNENIKITFNTEEGRKPDFASTFYGQVLYVGENYAEVRFHFTLTINQIEPVLIYDEIQTVIFNSSVQEVEFTCGYDDFYPNTVEYKVNDEWTLDVPMNVGSYEFRIHAGTENGNYIPTYFYGTFIILPQEVDLNISFDNKTVTYTGETQTIEVTGNTEGLDITYEYRLNDEVVESAVNVGVYTVIAYIDVEYVNTADQQLTATLTIEKADITEDNISNVGLPQYISVDYVPGMTVSDVLTKLTEKHLVPTDATMILKSGNNTIEVTYESKNYNDYTYDFEIRCKAHIKEIIVEELGKQFIGKSFDINNIIVVEKYNDTTEKEINITLENLVTDITTIDTNGVFTVVITYIEKEYSVTVTPVEAPQLMIYAAYGAGGLANAAYDRDFVVLYNNSAEAFDLTGYSVQTFSSSGVKKSIIPLTGTIPGYGFYTIASNEVGTNGSVLPFGETANINNYKIDLAQDKFIVCLSNSTTQIVLGDFTNYVDIVGVNGTYFEGTATAPAIDKTSYIKRISFTEDSNDNSIDFVKESFTSNSFDFLKDGYVAYFNAKEHIASQNKDFTKIEDELTFTVLTESVGRTISWKAYENEVETQMVKIVGNVVTATPIQLETHSIVLRGTVEDTDLTIEITLNLSNLEQLPTFELSINEDKLRVEWAQVGAATSYDIYVDSKLVCEKTTIYENNYYELKSVNKNATIKVVAKGPEGYLPSEATIDFEYQEIMQRRIVYTLNESSAVFNESYTLAGDFAITALNKGTKYSNVTLSYESEDVLIENNVITLSRPNEETIINIVITASIDGLDLIDNTTTVSITLIPASASHVLTQVTALEQLYDGIQIILTFDNLVSMGAFNSKKFEKVDFTIADKVNIDDKLGLTILTLRKVIVEEIVYWILETTPNMNICYESSTDVSVGEVYDNKALWNISLNNDDKHHINISSKVDPTRFIQYNTDKNINKFGAYKSEQPISAYIIEKIEETEINDTLFEVASKINDIYKPEEETFTIELPLKGEENENVSLEYSVQNATYSNGILTVQRPEEKNIIVILTVTATKEGLEPKSLYLSFVVINIYYKEDISEKVIVNYETTHTINENEPIEPVVEVIYNLNTLIKDIDYTVEYENNTGVTTEAKIIITFIDKYTGSKTLLFTIVEGTEPETPVVPSEPTTVTVSIADYAASNSWSNGTKYTTIKMDDNIEVTASGGGNTGKYYTDGNQWRIYETENPNVTICSTTKTIVSVKITYNIYKSGTLLYNGAEIASNTVIEDVNANSITLNVGNTGSVNNGQVRITNIVVVYQ